MSISLSLSWCVSVTSPLIWSDVVGWSVFWMSILKSSSSSTLIISWRMALLMEERTALCFSSTITTSGELSSSLDERPRLNLSRRLSFRLWFSLPSLYRLRFGDVCRELRFGDGERDRPRRRDFRSGLRERLLLLRLLSDFDVYSLMECCFRFLSTLDFDELLG